MKYLFYLLMPILFFSCDSNDDYNEFEDRVLLKRIDIGYSQYGNLKHVIYYQNEKPVVDSSFYFGDNYPEMYQYKRTWQYNDNGLVKKITSANYQNEDYHFVEISYDSQQRISLINNNDNIHSIFGYNNSQITKNYVYLTEGTDYIFHYEVNQNGNIISEVIPSGLQTAQVQYNNNDIVGYESPQISNLQFSYLDTSIPTFMKHPEFGEIQSNYILFTGSLNYTTLLNTGNRFIDQVSFDSATWSNLEFVYEFNEYLLPTYIKRGEDGYIYSETFFKYN